MSAFNRMSNTCFAFSQQGKYYVWYASISYQNLYARNMTDLLYLKHNYLTIISVTKVLGSFHTFFTLYKILNSFSSRLTRSCRIEMPSKCYFGCSNLQKWFWIRNIWCSFYNQFLIGNCFLYCLKTDQKM